MFKTIGCIICCCSLLMQACNLFSENPTSRSNVKWIPNYNDALSQAKQANKPLVILFTGSDWCSWCTKLDDEVLGTSEFAAGAGDKFVFYKADFPLYTNQDPQLKSQNKNLQQQFHIRSFPTIVVYDTQKDQTIGTSGYRPGGGGQFADYLLKLVNDYSSYNKKVSTLDSGKFSGSELKGLYEQAKKLNLNSDATKIISQGLNSDQSRFFLTERYRQLADEGKIHSTEAAALRNQLISIDPNNNELIPYQIAVIEFETNLELNSKPVSPALIVEPLTSYIDKFGSTDKEHLWRLEMLISQVYLDKNQMNEALKHAQLSHDAAPASAQPEISRAIKNIRTRLFSLDTA